MTETNLSIGTSCFIPIVSSIAVLAISHDLYAAASMFIIAFIYNVFTLFALIPIGGVFIQFWMVTSILNPWLIGMSLTVPENVNWIVDIVFWINILVGFFITILASIWLYDGMKSR